MSALVALAICFCVGILILVLLAFHSASVVILTTPLIDCSNCLRYFLPSLVSLKGILSSKGNLSLKVIGDQSFSLLIGFAVDFSGVLGVWEAISLSLSFSAVSSFNSASFGIKFL